MALAPTQPAMPREQLLRAAARQFVEGDVQHWWLPDTGQGVRTRISDDRALARPMRSAHYLDVTGDRRVLDEAIPFLEAALLSPASTRRFVQPAISAEHRRRSTSTAPARSTPASRSARTALPLMGGGDWNDGMNRVGVEGRGESVWLGWFLIATLASLRGRSRTRAATRAAPTRWREHAERPARGRWSTRPGTATGTGAAASTTARRSGSAASDECRIDSIAQSWAVLSGAGRPAACAARAMAAVDARADPPAGRPGAAVHAAFRSHGRTTPATSRAIRPACARTAASTPMPRCGR